MVLLAIDTSTSLIGAALHDGSQVVCEVTHPEDRRHAELLGPAVQQCLDESGVSRAEVSAVVVGVGPGPFTGLRVGVVTALVLGRALGVQVHALCSLDVLAAQTARTMGGSGELLVATDARRKEVYWARYVVTAGAASRTAGPGVGKAGELAEELRALPAVGRGADLYAESLNAVAGPRDVQPAALAELAVAVLDAGDPGGLLLPVEPLYLRRPDALERSARPATGAVR